MSIYRRDNGKFKVSINYKKLDGKYGRVTKDFKTKREAIAYEPILRSKALGVAPNDIQFETLAKDFLDESKRIRRYSTYIHYTRITRLHILPFFKETKIGQINRADIARWKKGLQNELSPKTKKHYSFLYLSHCFKVLKLIFGYGNKNYEIVNNSINQEGGFKKDPNAVTPQRVLHFWTPKQFNLFLKVIESEIGRLETKDPSQAATLKNTKVFLSICFYAGTRRGETNGLKVEDFHDGEYPYLSVKRSICEKVGLGHFIETNPKNTGSVRDVPIPSKLARIIREHIHTQLSKEYGYNPSFYLCGGPYPIPSSTADAIKVKVEKKAGLPHIKVHDLRHSYVSMLIDANVPIAVIAKLTGHSSPEITFKIYGHLMPQTQSAAIMKLEKIIGK
ncbi:MAG: site-specific integrase [Bacilli bacterium]